VDAGAVCTFLRVKAMAKRRGLHLDEVAERAGLSRTVFYTLKDPKVSTARAIADALGVTIDRLTRDDSADARRRSRAS